MVMGTSSEDQATGDRIESVPLGLRWINDAFTVVPTAGGVLTLMADMTQAKAALRLMRSARIPATMAHIIVRACALVLARNPRLHQMVCNYRRLTPGAVDIGLSLAGETTYAPVVVLPAAERLPLSKLVPTAIDAIDAAIEKEKVDLANMRKFLWLVPFRFLRRLLLRLMNGSLWFRRRIAGTFQITLMPSCDTAVPLLFYTGAILAAGGVRDRVVAVDGKAVVRPTMWLTVAVDHGALDGVRAGELIEAIKAMLESDELVREAQDACASKAEAKALPAPP
jgi:pyruvate/2-oxoglutarate dehydrogenase complex dihydrolipoamide acyltransferase (E2) component